MPDQYTNSRRGQVQPNQYIVQTAVRRPYASTGGLSSLTYKERLAREQLKIASLSGFGGASGAGNTTLSNQGNFFSHQLSTDFLELPQTLRERRELYRHFYETDELVAQAIDLHTELPLSKIRLAPPKPRTCPPGFKDPESYGRYILSRFQKMCKQNKLFQRLITIVHHYWLDGAVFIFAEDSVVEIPDDVGFDHKIVKQAVLTEAGEAEERSVVVAFERESKSEEEIQYYKKHYRGWNRLIVLPIDRVKVSTFSFTDKVKVELIPSDKDLTLLQQAEQGDEFAQEMVQEIPAEVREHLQAGKLIPLGTDPEEGSFVYMLSGRKSSDRELGSSILDRCHLPGTPVTVNRNGLIRQVPIEDLDPDTDTILTKEGHWQEFEYGARKINEEVCLIKVSKLYTPIACTADHAYPVLRDGKVERVLAKDIVPGDYLQVASVPLSETVRVADFEAPLTDLNVAYSARKSGGQGELQTTIIDRTSTHFTVQYEHQETNPRLLKRLDKVRSILEWASGLTSPTVQASYDICERFELKSSNWKDIRRQLPEYGYCPVVLKNHKTRFEPFVGELPPEPVRVATKKFQSSVELDADFGYLLGYWLGDGWVAKEAHGIEYGALGLCYGSGVSKSLESIAHLKPILDRLGVIYHTSKVHASADAIFGRQDALVRWLAGNFGHVCKDKHLPEWIFDAPREFLFGLLRGLVDSDGDIVLKKEGTLSIRISSSNKVLAEQLFLLSTSLGLPVSQATPTKERWLSMPQGSLSLATPNYVLHFSHGPSVQQFMESGFLAKKKPYTVKDGRSGSRHVLHEGNLYYRVKGVSEEQHNGLVFSLNVHNNHNFFVGFTNTYNCLRTLTFREKLRQAQTSIASRAMTPRRVVWAEGLSDEDTDLLREQVDLALVDPDYSIITNYELHWEEQSSRDRLLELSSEYEMLDKRMLTGLGVTESLMSGESLYSGDRLKLEVINQRYLLLREVIQEYVEDVLFIPVAKRMGFVEEDEWGDEMVLYPRLSFTRLPLRDSQDTFDAMFNLYQKGSLGIDTILESLNIDSNNTRTTVEQDLFTVNDAIFNEVLRSIYSEAGRTMVEKTDIVDRLMKYMKLGKAAPAEGGGGEENRF